MTDKANFRGYKWEGMSSFYRSEETHAFHDSINWNALCQYASKLNKNEPCTMDPQTTMGGRNLVRIIKFDNNTRWIARLRITTSDAIANGAFALTLQEEVDCMQLVKERTSIPVPTVFGYIANPQNDIGASFMLIECLIGNTAISLECEEPMTSQQRTAFYAEMARIQTEMSSLTFPKIGTVIRLHSGTYDIGPLPGLGGPFDTATEYLEAWAESAKFPNLEDVRVSCNGAAGGKIVDNKEVEEKISKLEASILTFPSRLKKLAANIPLRNDGPFPLIHSDFASWNVLVDDDYNVVGVIDWEYSHTGPWEMVHFAMGFMPTPAPMSPSEWYDSAGMPLKENLKKTFKEMEEYVDVVRQVEQAKALSPTLSAVLSDRAGQDLAYAMRLYTIDGKRGYYSKILDVHHERWGGGNKDSEAA